MGPRDVRIDQDCIGMSLGKVGGHKYWGAWDIDSDGKPDILKVEVAVADELVLLPYCFPAQTSPSEDSSRYEEVLRKFPNIAKACGHTIQTLTACTSRHLAAINASFFKAREQALETVDLFQDAVLNGKITMAPIASTSHHPAVYIADTNILDEDVQAWVDDQHHMSWMPVALLFNRNCPAIIIERGILEYCNTHSDVICEPDYGVSV